MSISFATDLHVEFVRADTAAAVIFHRAVLVKAAGAAVRASEIYFSICRAK